MNMPKLETGSTTEPNSLHQWCQTGTIEDIKPFLDHGVDINGQDHFQNTPLFYAAIVGRTEVVELLLEHGVNIDAKNHNHYTAVQKAAEEGHYEVVKILVDAGADIQSRDLKWGANPLLCATYWGYRHIIQLLCENQARVTGLSTHFGYTALHLACMKGHVEIVSDLIQYGADVNARAQNGVTPLLLSLGPKILSSIKILVEHGASVDLQDNRGEFALYCTAQNGWFEAVELLLSYGSDVYKQTKLGDTAIHAACYGNHAAVVKFLSSKYPELINFQGYQNNTPLHIAVSKGLLKLVKILLNHGASTTSVNSSHETPCEIAKIKGYSDIENLLQTLDEVPKTSAILQQTGPDFSDHKIIDQAMDILRKQFPHISGFQNVCCDKSKLFRPRDPLFVQILKFKSRFVLVSTLHLPAGHIELYDPCGTCTNLTSTIVKTVGSLMAVDDNPEFYIYHVKVRHSFSVSKSALVCLAVLTGVLFCGQCPSKNDMRDATRIEEHMVESLENGEFSSWYSDVCNDRRQTCSQSLQEFRSDHAGCRGDGHEVIRIIVSLHCVCPRPCTRAVKSQCNKCGCLYHSACAKHHYTEIENKTLQYQSTHAFLCPKGYTSQCLMTERLLKYPARYDAFVSYNYSDFWFIKQHLIPQLENSTVSETNFELVIAHRDFMPGAYIAESILETIIDSRNCVAVISKNFFKGHWNAFEWEQMVVHRWKSMFLILLDPVEEIVSAKWMLTLNSYLKTRPFLEWKKDYNHEEKVYFWKSLRYFLAPRL